MSLEVWDGRSETRDVDKYAAPDGADWNRAISEIAKTQQFTNVLERNLFYSEADESILAGQPLIIESNLKLAGTSDYPEVVGISLVNCAIGIECVYIEQGKLELDDWSNVTGEVDLTPNAVYFLSMQEKGKLTKIAPESSGNTVVQIGRAQNPKTLSIDIKIPVYLT